MGLLFGCLAAPKFTKIKAETDKRSLYVQRQSVTTYVPVPALAVKAADERAAFCFPFFIPVRFKVFRTNFQQYLFAV